MGAAWYMGGSHSTAGAVETASAEALRSEEHDVAQKSEEHFQCAQSKQGNGKKGLSVLGSFCCCDKCQDQKQCRGRKGSRRLQATGHH